MKIRLLGKSLVPYPYTYHDVPIFELMVHGIEVVNDTSGPIDVESVALALEKGPDTIVAHPIDGRRLGRFVKSAADTLNAMFETPWRFQFLFSRNLSRRAPWSDGTMLAPGEALAILHQHFFVRGDSLTRLAVTARSSTEEVRRGFRLKPFEEKNKYVFPVPGHARCFNGPALGIGHHRFTTSQEFAYDILPVNSHGSLGRGKGTRNRDFVGFRAPLVASAPGKVVVVRDGLPENPAVGAPPPRTKERIEEFGLMHVVTGNLVIIEHRHGEHTLLAHCVRDSIEVREGERVKRGQRLALLGNTGNSTGPHLHFQLMDGPDILKNRSLPITFSDVSSFVDGDPGQGEFLASTDPVVTTKKKT